jgi:phosphohistidine phosphatase
MKSIYLIRHAKSSWADINSRDINRTLNERGHKDAPFMAQILRGLKVQADLLVSSPAVRARTTAEYFAAAFGVPTQAIDIQRDIYEASETDLLNVIRALPDTAQTVLMFGHNPGITYFANRYYTDYFDNIPTCGIVHFELAADKWADFNPKTARVKGHWFPKEV